MISDPENGAQNRSEQGSQGSSFVFSEIDLFLPFIIKFATGSGFRALILAPQNGSCAGLARMGAGLAAATLLCAMLVASSLQASSLQASKQLAAH